MTNPSRSLDRAIEETRQNPGSASAWRSRVEQAWAWALSSPALDEGLFEDMLFSARQLLRLGDEDAARAAREDVASYTQDTPLFRSLDARYGLGDACA